MTRLLASLSLAAAVLVHGAQDGVKVSSFGYDPEDSTRFLQAALDSGERKLVLDRQAGPWRTLPLKMRSNTELVLESGVELVAKRGAYKGLRDYLLELPAGVTNCVIRGGAGSTLRMWKADYQGPGYAHGEWRYGLRLHHVTNVLVEGISIVETGGDGIGVTGKDITIRNCVCDRNHRQGISVFNAENLLIEDCVLSNTSGTAPQAGIDIEPDTNRERLVNVVLRNVVSRNNAGNGFELYLNNLDDTCPPISVRFENCRAEGNSTAASVSGGGRRTDHWVKGLVEFTNCAFLSPRRAGISVNASPAEAFDVRFADCVVSNAPQAVRFASASLRQGQPDGIVLANLSVFQTTNRPWFAVGGRGLGPVPARISGDVSVTGSDGTREAVRLDPSWAAENLPATDGGMPLPARVALPAARDVAVEDARPGELVRLSPLAFVGGARLVFLAEKSGPVRFTARQMTVVKDRPAATAPYVVSRLGADGRKLKSWKIAAKGFMAEDFVFNAPDAGFYALEVKEGGTRFVLERTSVPVAVDLTAREQTVAPLERRPFPLFIAKTADAPFALLASGDDYYRFGWTLADPAGTVRDRADCVEGLSFARGAADAPRGLWRIEFRKGARPVFDWIRLDLYGAPAQLFLTPEKTWRVRGADRSLYLPVEGGRGLFEEQPVHGRVRVELRMEGRREEVPLADRDGDAVDRRERLDVRPLCADGGRADERERNRHAAREGGVRVEAAELASVGVPFDHDVQEPEVDERIVLDLPREQDQSRARAERRQPRGDLRAQGFEEAEVAQELALDGRLAAREDESVERRIEVTPFADLERRRAEFGEAPFMLDERALEGEDADSHLPRSAMRSSISPSLMPTIASPRSSETSATTFGSLKFVTALTIAAARLAGLPLLKMPEPTKTPSAPSCIISAASAGVATPPAAKLTTGSLPFSWTKRTRS